jgi:hydrogenase nickel incorporation protein HypB
MCTTCGCGSDQVRIDGVDAHRHEHEHVHEDGTRHVHAHDHADGYSLVHDHPDGRAHAHDHPDGRAHAHDHADRQAHDHAHALPAALRGPIGAVHAPGVAPSRVVDVERALLEKNDALAAVNRRRFADRAVLALNLVSSPGSGKTTLLVKTIEAWGRRTPVAVIEGDQQTSRDADRIRATGAPAVQVNTGKGCHLDAQMVGRALDRLDPGDGSLLLIENVGNLVCPAAFDLGEAHKVVILSVTEGEDKPLKYPDMFRAADLMLLSKIDLLPHLDFDVEAAIGYAQRVRPGLPVLQVSATTGAGLAEWLAWLEAELAAVRARRDTDVAALRRRVAELEAKAGTA